MTAQDKQDLEDIGRQMQAAYEQAEVSARNAAEVSWYSDPTRDPLRDVIDEKKRTTYKDRAPMIWYQIYNQWLAGQHPSEIAEELGYTEPEILDMLRYNMLTLSNFCLHVRHRLIGMRTHLMDRRASVIQHLAHPREEHIMQYNQGWFAACDELARDIHHVLDDTMALTKKAARGQHHPSLWYGTVGAIAYAVRHWVLQVRVAWSSYRVEREAGRLLREWTKKYGPPREPS